MPVTFQVGANDGEIIAIDLISLSSDLAAVAGANYWDLSGAAPISAIDAAEAFVPRKRVGDRNVFDLELGGRIAILTAPNPTRCVGAACGPLRWRPAG
mgnify:CR=1 FL=1